MCCTFWYLRLGAPRGDAGHAGQKGSGLCSALSRAMHTSEMLLQVFLFHNTQHVLQQLFGMAALPGAKAAVPSRVSSAPKICIPDTNSSAVPICCSSVSGPIMRPQCHPACQQPCAQAFALPVPRYPISTLRDSLEGSVLSHRSEWSNVPPYSVGCCSLSPWRKKGGTWKGFFPTA